tara:strand:- start:5864 stop:7372 length:1509 start_codon:yes stop_codon:yes gene_type:complete
MFTELLNRIYGLLNRLYGMVSAVFYPMTPTASAQELERALLINDDNAIDRILNLPPEQMPDLIALKDALKMSLKRGCASYALTKNCTPSIINQALIECLREEAWDVIAWMTLMPSLHDNLDEPTINTITLLVAQASQWYWLDDILKYKSIAQKIHSTTMSQVLLLAIRLNTKRYEINIDVKLIEQLINLNDEQRPDVSSIQASQLEAIKMGRTKTVRAFQSLPESHQPNIESIIDAVKRAAQLQNYGTVVHLVGIIPSDRRLDILEALSEEDSNSSSLSLGEPKKRNTLHWAVCRNATEDLYTILNALSEPERFILITKMPNNAFYDHSYSPLITASITGRGENLTILLNSLSETHKLEAILPKKITIYTPFYSYGRIKKETLSALLSVLFGENQNLHDAYNELCRKCDINSLNALRNHFLRTNYPTKAQSYLSFFTPSFSIPGHPLEPEELNLIVRVVLYERYSDYDYIQRGAIEDRITAYLASRTEEDPKFVRALTNENR